MIIVPSFSRSPRLENDDPCDNCNKDNSKNPENAPLAQEMLAARVVIVSEEVSEALAKRIYAQLLLLNQRSSTLPITVYVNSVGGDADSGFGIYDLMRFIDAPVTTVVCGLCASAGVIIALGAAPGRRFCTPTSRYLLHQPATGTYGDASDVTITAEEIVKTREKYNSIVASSSGKTLETVTRDADRDFWLSADEAKAYGLVDSIASDMAALRN